MIAPIIELPGKLVSVDHIFLNVDGITTYTDPSNLRASEVTIHEHQNLLRYCELYYNYEKRVHVLKFVTLPKSTVIILTCADEA